MSRRFLLLPLLLITMLSLAACKRSEAGSAFQIGPAVTDSTIALILSSNGRTDTLSRSDFNQQFLQILQQYPQLVNSDNGDSLVRRQILEDFISMHVFLSESKDVVVDEAAIETQISEIRSGFESDSAYRAALAQQEVSETMIRRQLRERQQLEKFFSEHAEGIADPTQAEFDEFESERQAEGGQVRARHILFMVPQDASEDTVALVRNRAQEVLERAKAGEDFNALVATYSEEPGAAERGGDLGYFERGQMVPEFEQAAFALADSGAVTQELVRTQFGFHIIQLLGKQDAPAVDPERIRAYLKEQSRVESLRDLVKEKKARVTVRVNPEIIDPVLLEPVEEEEEKGEES